ncbi:hypothetical protein C2G38_812809 [Gigaspora rosea]|uniref:Uncharacterized protein n=1 Tax=Gigaspora rosea TaxID=44941 RepID=A0A397W5G0_9GLOM|nr:hypothetical protein C2G38_812809 [Gigaspora rosea]
MALAPSQPRFLRQFFQQFTLREDLPETSSIKYKLTCPKKGSVNLERKWIITHEDGFGGFSFDCLEQNNNPTFSLNDNFASSDKVTKLTSRDKITNSTLNNDPKIAHAQMIHDGLYLLNDGSKTGVVVISVEKVGDEDSLKDDFQELKKRGAKKIILDMSNNPGGDITFSLFLTSLLFSSKQPNSFPTDIIINDFTIPKIEKNFKESSTDPEDDDFYNPNLFLSFPFGKPFNSPS